MNTEKELIKKRGGVKAKLTQFSTYLNIAKSSDKLIGARGASGRRRGAIQRAEPARGPVLRAGVAGAHPAGGPARPCAQPAMVMVGDRHGRLHKARLLLDNGSTANFVTDRLCTKLGLVRRDTGSTVTGIDNQATVTDANIKLLPRYQRVEQIRQHFWNRFSNEYLSLLQQKTKWHRSSPEQLMEGTLVLVKDRTMPPLLWPLGRIIKVHPGTDGITRVVDVLTKKGTIQRAYNNICPLPTS
ncbi:uncharacterized protein LOC105383070 isoform X2 [Plutella xylostella]|uniref:uncharacterized protein LOC105383070 isoform X2 n=1 Tax=Plutella xylostella TaxID=51655 RepID=UPI0020327F01|nr:uncharacterized protein LOC105383070 isoform X2 [Plutella xylostella]